MAAGDIIIPDNTITPELLDKIAAEVQKRIASTSKDPGQYDIVESLQGLTSLPVFQQSGSSFKLVRVLISIFKGDKGDPFIYSDFTPDQLDALALTYDKLTPDQKTELKIKLADLTDEDIASLQKPANDYVENVAKPAMIKISQDVSQAIADTEEIRDRADTAAEDADQTRISLAESVERKLTEVDNRMLLVQDGKTTQFEIGTVESGATPSALLTDNGTDADGNPKKALNLVMEKGEKGDKGNTLFATFDIDPVTGELAMYTDEEYTGADFEITEKGELQVII